MKKLTIRERIQYKSVCENLGFTPDEMTAQLIRNMLQMNAQYIEEAELDDFNEGLNEEPIFDRIGNQVIYKRGETLYLNDTPISLNRYYEMVQGHQIAEETRMRIEDDKFERELATIQRRRERLQVQPEDLDSEWHTDVVLEDTEKYDGKYVCFGELELDDNTILKGAWYTVNKYCDYKGNMIVGHASMNQVGYVIGQHLSNTFIGMAGCGVAWNGQEILDVTLDETDDVPPALFGKTMIVSLKDGKVLWSKFKDTDLPVVLDIHEQEDEKQISECRMDDTHKLHTAQQAMTM